MKKYKEKTIYIFLFLVVLFFLVVFIKIHPLILYDADDWGYCSYERWGLPVWKGWNPSRILPENLMSWCSAIGVFLLMPITGDFIQSLAIIYGLVLTFFVFVYVYTFCLFLRKKLKLSSGMVISLALIFLIFHFLVFQRSIGEERVQHMFSSVDVTCYFYYVIPNLLLSSLVMYFITNGFPQKIISSLKTGVMILIVYLAVFSNMFQTIILMSFMGGTILYDVFQTKKNKGRFTDILKRQIVPLLIIGMWLISMAFEMSGGRANYLAKEQFPLWETCTECLWFLKNGTNRTFLIIAVVSIFTALITFGINRKKHRIEESIYQQCFGLFIVCGAVSLIFEILLCAKTIPQYITRTDILFSFVFYVFLLIVISLYYIVVNYRKLLLVLPLIIYVAFSITALNTGYYTVSAWNSVDYQICKKIDDYFIEEFIKADKNYEEKVVLRVPVASGIGNWPHDRACALSIAKALYKYKVINRKIVDVEIIPDVNINKRFGLNPDGTV